MPDVFDQLERPPSADVFDEVSSSPAQPDVFDQIDSPLSAGISGSEPVVPRETPAMSETDPRFREAAQAVNTGLQTAEAFTRPFAVDFSAAVPGEERGRQLKAVEIERRLAEDKVHELSGVHLASVEERVAAAQNLSSLLRKERGLRAIQDELHAQSPEGQREALAAYMGPLYEKYRGSAEGGAPGLGATGFAKVAAGALGMSAAAGEALGMSDTAQAMRADMAGFERVAEQTKGHGAEVVRGLAGLVPLIAGLPEGKAGAAQAAVRAAAESYSSTLNQTGDTTAAYDAAVQTAPEMAAFMLGGAVAGRGVAAMLPKDARAVTVGLANLAGAEIANVGVSNVLAALHGQDYGLANFSADTLLALYHGTHGYKDRVGEVERQRAAEKLRSYGWSEEQIKAPYDGPSETPAFQIIKPTEEPTDAIQNRSSAPPDGDVLNRQGTPEGAGPLPAEVSSAGVSPRRQGEGLAPEPRGPTPQEVERKLGPGAANIEEPLGEGKPIGAYNAAVDERRVARGLEPLMSEARKSSEVTWKQAEARIEADPEYARNLVDTINEGKKPSVTDVEQDTLLWRMIDLQNRKSEAEIRALDDSTFAPEERAAFAAEASILETQLQATEEANRKAGTSSGRALNIRRQLANEDFTLAGMMRRAELAKGDKLTKPEIDKIRQQSEGITESEKGFGERERKLQEGEAEAEATDKVGQMRRKRPKGDLLPVEEERTNLLGAIAQEKAAGREAKDLRSWIQRLAENFVRGGIKERDPLVKAVHQEVMKVFPDLTERQTRDLISGYGDFKPLSKEQVKTELRDIKGQLQNISKLEDIQGRKPLARTGVERRVPSDEERRLIQQVNEAKRKYGVVVTDPEKQLKSALDARKTYYRNRISDLKAEIAARERNVKSATRSPSDTELEKLKAELEQVKADHDALFNTDEVKTAKAINAYKSALERRAKDLQQRMAKGDFAPKARKPLDISKDAEAVRLKTRADNLRREFNQQREKWRLAQRSAGKKFLDTAADLIGSSRTLITSADVSAPFRQGAVLSIGDLVFNPLRFGRQLRRMFGSLVSEKQFQKLETQIRLRENSRNGLYEKSGLYLSDLDGKFTNREETMRSNLAEKVPLVRRSNRAYADFLNQQRADAFDSFVDMMGGRDRVTPAQAEFLASAVNELTGRGGIKGSHVGAANLLARFLFSPRFLISRFKVLVGEPIWRGIISGPAVGAKARAIVALQYGKFAAGLGVLYGLAALAGGKVEKDRRSTDFGKIRFGSTRVDPMGGLQQLAVLLSRGLSGKTKDLSGNVKPVKFDTLGNFVRGKLAPIPGAAVDLTFGGGKNVVGEKVTPLSTLKRLTVPISYDDLPAVYREHGAAKATVLEVLNLLGMGLQQHRK